MTTHVLDTAHGRPAADLAVEVHDATAPGSEPLRMTRTNGDGRVDAPLLAGADFVAGAYQLVFHCGDYFRAQGVALADPAFLDVVVVRIGVADADAHYHVPLLVSPFGYTTYRGS